MRGIDIAVVEDSDDDFETLLSCLKKYEEERVVALSLERFVSAESFLFSSKSFSILILDIELAGMNGMDLARRVRENDKNVVIIFITNLAQYVYDGYEVEAMDYILKPIKYEAFSLKFTKALSLAKTRTAETIFLQSNDGYLKVDITDILYIEVSGHKIFVHCSDRVILTNGTLNGYEEKMNGAGFLRCNSCFLVNPKRIVNVKQYDCYLDNGETIAISHPKKKKFVEKLREYAEKRS